MVSFLSCQKCPLHDEDQMSTDHRDDGFRPLPQQEQSDQQQPILMLPASTTAAGGLVNASNPQESSPPSAWIHNGNNNNNNSYDNHDDENDIVGTSSTTIISPGRFPKKYGSGLANLGNTCFMVRHYSTSSSFCSPKRETSLLILHGVSSLPDPEFDIAVPSAYRSASKVFFIWRIRERFESR